MIAQHPTHIEPMQATNSPWTELYQGQEAAPANQPSAEDAPNQPHAEQPDARAEEAPTHDALRTIFEDC
jgi:hypothetical protein